MVKTVIKADGAQEVFMPEKMSRWIEYADKYIKSGLMTTIFMETYKRLPEVVSSEDLQQALIDVCVEQEHINASRMAARLELGKIRKHMDRNLMSDKEDFTDIMQKYFELGIWDEATFPAINKRWNQWYYKLYDNKLEHWQIKQFVEKYGRKLDNKCIETPHIAALGIGLALHGDTDNAFKMAEAIIEGKLNLPTPALNGCRNGDFDSISCCVITGGDSVESIEVAQHVATRYTAKKAGIGFELQTRSKGSDVKGGAVKHLGKHPLYSHLDTGVKEFTQVTRGGSATVSAPCLDPEIMSILQWKTQKVDLETRLDKLDYSMVYNDAFLFAVVNDLDWHLFDFQDAPNVHEAFYTQEPSDYDYIVASARDAGVKHTTVKARDLLRLFLTSRTETGRVYCFNVSRANTHTPFIDRITLSNLCQEICLPTKPYTGMLDLYVGDAEHSSEGETAFCSLSAINVGRVSFSEYNEVAEIALRTVDKMIEKAPAMTRTMYKQMQDRRSVGIGITGLADYLYKNGLDYDGSPESMLAVSQLSEIHYHSLLTASQLMVEDGTCKPVQGVDLNWLPIDTALNNYTPRLNWELLRGKPRGHSVLVANMPTESSAVFSDAVNGLYPPRQKVLYKKARTGIVQFIVKAVNPILAWDVDNITMAKYYSRVQDFCDQGISADYFQVPQNYEGGKLSMTKLMEEWIAQAYLGVKSAYYQNTKDKTAQTIADIIAAPEEEGCTSCKL